MKDPVRLTHEFVDFIPDRPESGVLYVSIRYATAVHLCACGCGHKAVTPLTPKDWKLTFDGESISLHPSVGNWGFRCRSHYWIRNDHAQPVKPRTADPSAPSQPRSPAPRVDRAVTNADAAAETGDQRHQRGLAARLRPWRR